MIQENEKYEYRPESPENNHANEYQKTIMQTNMNHPKTNMNHPKAIMYKHFRERNLVKTGILYRLSGDLKNEKENELICKKKNPLKADIPLRPWVEKKLKQYGHHLSRQQIDRYVKAVVENKLFRKLFTFSKKFVLGAYRYVLNLIHFSKSPKYFSRIYHLWQGTYRQNTSNPETQPENNNIIPIEYVRNMIKSEEKPKEDQDAIWDNYVQRPKTPQKPTAETQNDPIIPSPYLQQIIDHSCQAREEFDKIQVAWTNSTNRNLRSFLNTMLYMDLLNYLHPSDFFYSPEE